MEHRLATSLTKVRRSNVTAKIYSLYLDSDIDRNGTQPFNIVNRGKDGVMLQ